MFETSPDYQHRPSEGQLMKHDSIAKQAKDYTVRAFHTHDEVTDRCRWCGKRWPCLPIARLSLFG